MAASNRPPPQRMPPMEFRVVARYDGAIDTAKDKALFAAAGRYSDGSGCGFGERDHAWDFPTKDAADLCAAKLGKVAGVTVTVHDDRRN